MSGAVDLSALDNGAAEQVTIQVHSITTLTNVHVTVEAEVGRQTIVITRMPSGDQTRIPMDPIYAAGVRRDWDAAVERSRLADAAAEPAPPKPRGKKK